MTEALKYILYVAAAAFSYIVDRQQQKREGVRAFSVVPYLIVFILLISSASEFYEAQDRKIERDSARAKTMLQEADLGRLIDSAAKSSRELFGIEASQENELRETRMELYPIAQMKIVFSVDYIFSQTDPQASEYFNRIGRLLNPAKAENAAIDLWSVDEKSPYFPDPTNRMEGSLSGLLRNPAIRLSFRLLDKKQPSLVYSNHVMFPKYFVFAYDNQRRISFNVALDNRFLFVDSETIISPLDLVGSILTLELSPTAPPGSVVEDISFELRHHDTPNGLANMKHVVKLGKAMRIWEPKINDTVIAYRIKLSASDLGLSNVWQPVAKTQ